MQNRSQFPRLNLNSVLIERPMRRLPTYGIKSDNGSKTLAAMSPTLVDLP
jgi:hypothetical protein